MNTTQTDAQIDPSVIRRIAEGAGKKILAYYRDGGPVETKADDSPLTRADRAAHEHIDAALREAYPDVPVLSEESAEPARAERQAWSRFWLVDPLDGTKDFIKETGYFTVNIALIEGDRPVLGLIHVPAKNLTYWALDGDGAWRSDDGGPAKRLTVTAPDFAAPRIVASRDHAGPDVAALLERFPGNTCLSIGSSLKFCLVAEGEADAYLRDVPTFEWDVAAAQAIVTEAGGTVYDLATGRPLSYNKDDLRNGALLTLGHSRIEDWGVE